MCFSSVKLCFLNKIYPGINILRQKILLEDKFILLNAYIINTINAFKYPANAIMYNKNFTNDGNWFDNIKYTL